VKNKKISIKIGMRKELYLLIKSRLKGIKNSGGEQLFQHFDLWNKQVEFIEQESPFGCPAVFVEFLPLEWGTLGHRVQDARLVTRLHIVTEWYAGTADYSPTESQALDFLDIADRVVAAMQGFQTDFVNSWMRSASITNHDHERYVDNVEEYVCNVRDLSAVRTDYVAVTPQLTINN
jgi:hypothetical protein